MTAQPIPEGFHTITPHLTLKGAKEAIAFYRKAFGAETLWIHEMPGTEVVMNACLRIGDTPLMLNDEFPDHGVVGPQGRSPVVIHLYVEDVDAAFQRAVDAGATVLYPIENAFWGDRYGMLQDPFGHAWSIATHVEDVPPEEMGERAMKAFGGGGA